MLSIREIAERNARTFYDYRTGKRVSISKRYILIGLSSVCISALFNSPFSDLYAAFIAAQAILVGFSFNVLVYLSSSDILIQKDTAVLEEGEKVEKLNRLSGEIFDNLSYFNMVALLSILLSLLVIGGNAFSHEQELSNVLSVSNGSYIASALAYGRDVLRWVVVAFAYATVLDSLLTFARVSKRVTYFFTEKRKLAA